MTEPEIYDSSVNLTINVSRQKQSGKISGTIPNNKTAKFKIVFSPAFTKIPMINFNVVCPVDPFSVKSGIELLTNEMCIIHVSNLDFYNESNMTIYWNAAMF